MNERQARFVVEYAKDLNATQAAIRAGYSQASAGQIAHVLLKNDEILKAIDERKEAVAAMAGIDVAWVLKQWADIAMADPNELMQVRRVCCRHCHGYGHQYQWSEAEYVAKVNAAIDAGKPAPDGAGGFGFDPNREPHPECPECGGEGYEHVHVTDSRKLTGRARKLYAGVQRTKDGIKVLTRDQDAALAKISQYLGMQLERREISGPGGGPVAVATLKAEDLSDDQLAAIVAGSGGGDGIED